jgi:hypothetical protein
LRQTRIRADFLKSSDFDRLRVKYIDSTRKIGIIKREDRENDKHKAARDTIALILSDAADFKRKANGIVADLERKAEAWQRKLKT